MLLTKKNSVYAINVCLVIIIGSFLYYWLEKNYPLDQEKLFSSQLDQNKLLTSQNGSFIKKNPESFLPSASSFEEKNADFFSDNSSAIEKQASNDNPTFSSDEVVPNRVHIKEDQKISTVFKKNIYSDPLIDRPISSQNSTIVIPSSKDTSLASHLSHKNKTSQVNEVSDKTVLENSFDDQQGETVSVVSFSEGSSSVEKGIPMIKGEIDMHPAETIHLTTANANKVAAQDAVILPEFFFDLANKLVSGYWPAGTHLEAKRKGIVITSLKSLNKRYGFDYYGTLFQGKQNSSLRRRILNYILKPSTVRTLSALYSEQFITNMIFFADKLVRTKNKKPYYLTSNDRSEMLHLYANKARGVAGTIKAFLSDASMKQLVEEVIQSEKNADKENKKYMEFRQSDKKSNIKLINSYDIAYANAVVKKENAYKNLVASLRRSYNTYGLGNESLLYISLWLSRKDVSHYSGLIALAETLFVLADNMDSKAKVIHNGQ